MHPPVPPDIFSAEVQDSLTEARNWLNAVWLTGVWKFGSTVRNLWVTYLTSHQHNQSPIFYLDGSDISKSFKESRTTRDNLRDIYKEADARVMAAVSNSTGNESWSRDLGIEKLLYDNPRLLLYTPPGQPRGIAWDFDRLLEVPGNIAGGSGDSDLYLCTCMY